MLEPDEIPKMSGEEALVCLGSSVLLLMGGVREALDERDLTDLQIGRLNLVYVALATCSHELTEIAAEFSGE